METFAKGNLVKQNNKQFVLTLLDTSAKTSHGKFMLHDLANISLDNVKKKSKKLGHAAMHTTLADAIGNLKTKANKAAQNAKANLAFPHVLAVGITDGNIVDITQELMHLEKRSGMSEDEIRDQMLSFWYKDAVKNITSMTDLNRQRVDNYIDEVMTVFNSKVIRKMRFIICNGNRRGD